MNKPMRFDLQVIASWIEPGSKVLDLGCGAGDLLHHLKTEKSTHAAGIELQEEKVLAGIAKGLPILHGDINQEIRDYPDASFDYVILSQTLQQVYNPAELISHMLRVGRLGIVSFPNFSHLKNRLSLLLQGRAPISRELPYEWYDTPNIRVICIKDFRRFCARMDYRVHAETAISTHHHASKGRIVRHLPNLRATYGIFLLGK